MLLTVIGIMISFVLSGCGGPAPAETIVVSEESTTVAAAPQMKKGLQTILVMGLDDYERPEKKIGYLNDMQNDFILLVVIDEVNHTFEGLHINRDTMAKVNRLGVFGAETGAITMQLALAHTYGSGGSDSCLNAVKAVSNFLGGIKIDHYMTFTMESVGVINDMVGGVKVLIKDDFSAVDPDMELGQEITLQGDQALKYVRTRKDVGDMSNVSRMERQREYMNLLYQKVMEASAKDENFVKNLTLKLSDSFMTDCSISQLDTLAQTMATCEMKPFRTIDGEAVKGKEFMEFYPDQVALEKTIQELFYETVSE